MHRPHKGSRCAVSSGGSSKKINRPKLSAQRLAKLRGNNVMAHGGHSVVSERSKDLRTSQEINEILPWVCCHGVMAQVHGSIILTQIDPGRHK
jgi:hypothetical protein